MATQRRAHNPEPRRSTLLLCQKCGSRNWRVVTSIELTPGERMRLASYTLYNVEHPDWEIHCAECGARGPNNSYGAFP